MAATRVGQVGELVGNIMLHLPVKDLLFAQKVSRLWRISAILSVPLRRALFLVPRNSTIILLRRTDEQSLWPIVDEAAIVNIVSRTTGIIQNSIYQIVLASEIPVVHFHPLLCEQPGAHRTARDLPFLRNHLVKGFEDRVLPLHLLTGVEQEPTASCDSMFLSQPPCRRMVIQIKTARSQGAVIRQTARTTVHSVGGVRLGDVVERVKEEMDQMNSGCRGENWRVEMVVLRCFGVIELSGEEMQELEEAVEQAERNQQDGTVIV